MAENPTTKPIDPATLALAQAILTGGGGAGQPNVSLPPTQKYGMFKRTKEIDDAGITSDPGAPSPLTGYVYVLNPNYVEKPNAGPLQKMDDGALIRVNTDNTIDTIVPAAPKPQTLDQQTVTVNGRVYGVDPNNPTGDLIPRTAKDLTEDEAKKSADRARREQNQALTGHYATDDEMLDYTVKLNKAGVDKQAAQRDQAKFESDQRRLDADEARKAAAAPLDLAGKTATTAGTIASTQQTLQNLDINKAKLPGELKQQDLTAAGTEAATAASQQATATSKQAQQIAGAPQVQAPPTGMYTYTRNPLTGEVTQGGINAEYQAKTQAEVAARVGQIQSLMQAKQAEVQGKVGQTIAGKLYTADDALKDFNAWHAQNVQPQIGALQAAQQDAAFQQAKDQAAMRTQAYNAANAAGTQAISAFGAMQNGRVGPNFEAANQAASRGDFKALGNVQDATGYTAPDLTQTAPQAVMDALKYVDPTAARATGMPMPNYQNVDIGQTLGAMPYMPGGGAPPAPPPPPPPPPPAPEPVPAMAGARFKPGWPGSDPRLSGILDPTQFQQYFGNYSPGF